MQGTTVGLQIDVKFGEDTHSLEADYVIDATGLVSNIHANPVLDDLAETYGLPLNPQGRFEPDASFEMRELRHGDARLFVAGVCTLGASYAPVDSFLGLQYAAQRSIEKLDVEPLTPRRSVDQWFRWLRGLEP